MSSYPTAKRCWRTVSSPAILQNDIDIAGVVRNGTCTQHCWESTPSDLSGLSRSYCVRSINKVNKRWRFPTSCNCSHLIAVPLVIWTGGKIVSCWSATTRIGWPVWGGKPLNQPRWNMTSFIQNRPQNGKNYHFFVCQRVNPLWLDWDVGYVGQ